MSKSGYTLKRAYDTVSVARQGRYFRILFDGATTLERYPRPIALPTRALAEAVAAEWAAAGDMIELAAMPLTRLATAATHASLDDRARWAQTIVTFAGSDLLCYRASAPAALVDRQTDLWTPLLDWAAAHMGANFLAAASVGAIEQPADALDAVRTRLAPMHAWTLLGTVRATELTGSAVLALALEAGAFPAERLFRAARLDEDFQRERWGMDAEAMAREQAIRRDFETVAQWLNLSSPPLEKGG